MNIDFVIKEVYMRLAAAKIENAAMEAKWLSLETAGLSPCNLSDTLISAECFDEILKRTTRRINHEPLQYILESAPFRNLDLFVSPAVLIPRPETELLAQWVIDNLPVNGKFLDLGTGSGAIALAVAQERPDADVTAVDCSSDALQVAKINMSKYNLRLRLVLSDLFENLKDECFDLIGANLPYVSCNEYLDLSPEVKEYEPRLALTADNDGLALISRTIDGLKSHLTSDGAVIFELSPTQSLTVSSTLVQRGFNAEIRKDYTGRERFVCGRL